MLQLFIEKQEFFNEDTEEFYEVKPQKIVFEHSLLSLSKWEAKWKKPFLYGERTTEEMLDYIRCMTITPNVDPMVYSSLTNDQYNKLRDYIDESMTATTINNFMNKPVGPRNRIVTSELIYYWMTALNIPFECEKWHLTRLITLIRICNIENDPKRNKMSRHDIMKQNAQLNKARRAKYHTRG